MTKRIVYFDYLRVISIIAVVVLHAAAQNWSLLSGRSYEWNVFNVYDSLVRWCVPVFLMISGALFLSREIDIGKLYKKNILRMVVVFAVWSAFYAVASPAAEYIINGSTEFSFKSFVGNLIGGNYHMWFIPTITCLYMCVPIIKEIIRSKKIVVYFLLLSIVFAFALPQAVSMVKDFAGGLLAQGASKIGEVINAKTNMHLVAGYTFYFILGYFLNEMELTKKHRSIIYVLGLVGFALTVVLNAVVAWETGEPSEAYYGHFRVNVLFEAVAVFTWFKYKEYNNSKLNAIVSALSKCSFGVYLVQSFVLRVMKLLGMNNLMCSAWVAVPVVSVVAAVIAFAVSWLINKIPKINKWIV